MLLYSDNNLARSFQKILRIFQDPHSIDITTGVTNVVVRPSLTAVNIEVNSFEKGLVVHFADQAKKRSWILVEFWNPVHGR